ncbi:MAG: cytochrome c biogenesis protein CcsA [Polyangiales bacterium]|nr:cytochrome c biogenesis protein CcsA [Myxococcales bacterium]
MTPTLAAVVGTLYAVACAVFLVHLSKGSPRLGNVGRVVLAAAALAHLVYVGAVFSSGAARPMASIYQTLSMVSLAMVLAFLATSLRYRTTVLGAFITPVTLLFFLGAVLGATAEPVPSSVTLTLLPVHIAVNVLGIAAFALAFAAALAYLIQERKLRTKELGGIFQRLPSLDVLDMLGYRFLLVGFPLLTVGLVTGAFWIVGGATGQPHYISPAQGLGVVTWIVFAGVLILRTVAGWRGRKAALGTMFGFACASLVLLAYVINSFGGAS